MAEPLSVAPSVGILQALRALADENRLRIVDVLRGGEHCVCELQDDLGLGQSLLSHHLRVLREAGLVRDRRDGRWIHYALSEDTWAEVEGFLRELREEARDAGPRGHRCAP